MEIFDNNDSWRSRYVAGVRASRNLRRALQKNGMNRIRTANLALRTEARALEDVGEEVTEAIADRDMVSEGLSDNAAHVRVQLITTPQAAKQLPYTAIFNKTMAEFTKVPNDEVTQRFTNLVKRLEDNLPEDHPVRVEWVPVLRAQLQDWDDVGKEVIAARAKNDQAKGVLDKAMGAWDTTWSEVYAETFHKVGKRLADRYFSRKGRTAKKPAPTASATPQTAPAANTTPAADAAPACTTPTPESTAVTASPTATPSTAVTAPAK